MTRVLDGLRAGLNRCNVRNERVLIGVSGGADSVALLCGLSELASQFAFNLNVAHFNHGLRGVDSDADAVWVRDLAAKLHITCEVGMPSIGSLSADACGIEENARNLRYLFLDEIAAKLDCRTIALAHTADDQAETVLHHILRGTGISGLCGIPETRMTAGGNRLIRPLLGVNRVDVEAYLDARGQSFRTDNSNVDTTLTRNRLRHVILPLLREQINPQVDVALIRLAEQAAEIDEVIQLATDTLINRCVLDRQPDACRIDINQLTNEARHLIRSLFCRIWELQNWPRQSMGFEQWNRLAEAVHTRSTITLPNRIEARFQSETLLVLRKI